jgi:hypothetical protein
MAVIKIKRGTAAVVDAASLSDYEIAFETDTKKLVVYDGSSKKKYSADDAVNNIALTNIVHGASRGIMHYAGASFTPTLLAAPVDGYVLKGGGTTTDLAFEAINASEVVAGTYPAGDHIFSRVLSYGAGLVTSNVAIGTSALNANTTGNYNTACGSRALQTNTTGVQNVAVGDAALYANLVGCSNVAVGRSALAANLADNNTACGYNSLTTNTTGVNNTAVGASALEGNQIGVQNVAVGGSALASAVGNSNSVLGYQAAQALTTGYENVAVGYTAMRFNLTGINNVALGVAALRGASNQSFSNCTAVGTNALAANTTGANNTAVGTSALETNSIGTSNVGIGYWALYANTTGVYNTAVGTLALDSVTTGSNLTAIGYDADASSATATNEVTLGNASVATLRCQVTSITAISDERDKTNIGNIPVGLEFINRLKPREFTWNMRDGSKVGIPGMGFLAQELQIAQKEEGVTIPGLVYDVNPERLEVASGNLLVVMVRAIQELSARVKELEAR